MSRLTPQRRAELREWEVEWEKSNNANLYVASLRLSEYRVALEAAEARIAELERDQ